MHIEDNLPATPIGLLGTREGVAEGAELAGMGGVVSTALGRAFEEGVWGRDSMDSSVAGDWLVCEVSRVVETCGDVSSVGHVVACACSAMSGGVTCTAGPASNLRTLRNTRSARFTFSTIF